MEEGREEKTDEGVEETEEEEAGERRGLNMVNGGLFLVSEGAPIIKTENGGRKYMKVENLKTIEMEGGEGDERAREAGTLVGFGFNALFLCLAFLLPFPYVVFRFAYLWI